MADLAFRVQHVIKTEIDVTQAQLSRNNIEMLIGHGQLSSIHTRRGRQRAGAAGVHGATYIIHRHRNQAGGFDEGAASTAATSSIATRFWRCRRFRRR